MDGKPQVSPESWRKRGHYPQVEDPERVAEAIGTFFGRVDESA